MSARKVFALAAFLVLGANASAQALPPPGGGGSFSGSAPSFTATAADGSNGFVCANEGCQLCLDSASCLTLINGDSAKHGMEFGSNVAATGGVGFYFYTQNTITTGSLVSLTNGTNNALTLDKNANPTWQNTAGTVGVTLMNSLSASAAAGSTQWMFDSVNDLPDGYIFQFKKAGSLIANLDRYGSLGVQNNLTAQGSVFAQGSNPVPSIPSSVAGGGQYIEYNRGATNGTANSSGVLAVTFDQAFGVAPSSCTCNDHNAAVVGCNVTTDQTTVGVTFSIGAARADRVDWICIGSR